MIAGKGEPLIGALDERLQFIRGRREQCAHDPRGNHYTKGSGAGSKYIVRQAECGEKLARGVGADTGGPFQAQPANKIGRDRHGRLFGRLGDIADLDRLTHLHDQTVRNVFEDTEDE